MRNFGIPQRSGAVNESKLCANHRARFRLENSCRAFPTHLILLWCKASISLFTWKMISLSKKKCRLSAVYGRQMKVIQIRRLMFLAQVWTSSFFSLSELSIFTNFPYNSCLTSSSLTFYIQFFFSHNFHETFRHTKVVHFQFCLGAAAYVWRCLLNKNIVVFTCRWYRHTFSPQLFCALHDSALNWLHQKLQQLFLSSSFLCAAL